MATRSLGCIIALFWLSHVLLWICSSMMKIACADNTSATGRASLTRHHIKVQHRLMGPWSWGLEPSGVSQGPSHPSAKSGVTRGDTGSSPSPRHRAPPPGQEQSKAGPRCGPAGGPGSAGPMTKKGRAVGSWRLALLDHGWGRTWWPWRGWQGVLGHGQHRETWAGTAKPGSACRAMALWNIIRMCSKGK